MGRRNTGVHNTGLWPKMENKGALGIYIYVLHGSELCEHILVTNRFVIICVCIWMDFSCHDETPNHGHDRCSKASSRPYFVVVPWLNLGFSISGGTPISQWFIRENTKRRWTGWSRTTDILGTLHMMNFNAIHTFFQWLEKGVSLNHQIAAFFCSVVFKKSCCLWVRQLA